MIVICLCDKKLQERLLRKINLSLDRTVESCKIIELTRSHAKAIQQGALRSNDYVVDAIWRN